MQACDFIQPVARWKAPLGDVGISPCGAPPEARRLRIERLQQ
jgi:hypothetical protein